VIESPIAITLVTPSFLGSNTGSVVFDNKGMVGINANFEIIFLIINKL
jgi:hypothetical protein